MTRSNRNKAKGSTYERELVRHLQDAGLVAYRQPLSGALAREEWKGDIRVELPDDRELVIECKYRAKGSGFGTLYDLLADCDCVVLAAANMVAMRFDAWVDAMLSNDERSTIRLKQYDGAKAYNTLRAWNDGADYLALRMARASWIVVQVREMPNEIPRQDELQGRMVRA